ncbi:unnamed protein product [Kuraishia capsulata CBS 1993]|uniref:Uncharacterized protein n=1 Tax=Kuraishia capsulata CBS 1993 TaxID=1382522 RepID=W6MXE4_9ASCO|nr:uncharacterized protein KUCA_T00004729001 [Kuraishia capsulata CBS 1993]CDK28745.1 unnamed protein product [Kuraishia capsulata CBS 1993]
MELQWILFGVLFSFASCVLAEKAVLTNDLPQFCTGMYSKQDWDGDIEPHIEMDFQYFKSGDNNVDSYLSVVIFEFSDMDALGVKVSDISTHYVCTEQLVSKGLCDTSELYQFIVDKNVTPKTEILSSVLTSYGGNGLLYKISKTGYYCVACYSPPENRFRLQVNFQNSFGNLPASAIPRLKLHGLMAIAYAVCLSVYLYRLFIHRSEVILLQKYLGKLFVFLTMESIITWFWFAFLNSNKTHTLYPMQGATKFCLFLVSVLNAFKVASAFFVLVIISNDHKTQYSRHTPGRSEPWQLSLYPIFLFCDFAFGYPFIMLSFFNTISQPRSGPSGYFEKDDSEILLWGTGILATIAFTACYYLALSILWGTIKLLAKNKLKDKQKLYQKLFGLLSLSALLLVFAIVSSLILKANNSFTELKNLTSLCDLWSSYIFFMAFIGVAFLFRPSHSLYLLSRKNWELDNQYSEGQLDVYRGNEFELDDLQDDLHRLERARLVDSSSDPSNAVQKF